jgi:methyl-accepting chemotaxis protein
MNELTQHNASLVEEINAAIAQTEAQAGRLDRIVDIFTLSRAPAPNEASVPAARPVPGRVVRLPVSGGNAAIERDWAEF